MSILDLLQNANNDWFEAVWREREEKIYPELFGALPPTVIPVGEQSLRDILGADRKILPEWLHYAVIEIAPNERHNDWIYVTTAFSQPWNAEKEEDLNPEGISGAGIELLLRTPERASWAVDVLHRLSAYQIGVVNKLIKGKLFDYGDWMPLNGPIDSNNAESLVRGMVITRPRDFPDHFRLTSGRVNLLQIVGITGVEVAFLLNVGALPLEALLYEEGVAPTTDPNRATITLPKRYPLPEALQSRF